MRERTESKEMLESKEALDPSSTRRSKDEGENSQESISVHVKPPSSLLPKRLHPRLCMCLNKRSEAHYTIPSLPRP